MSLKPVKILAALALMAGVSTASAATFVTWTSPTAGSANGITVTASYTDTKPPPFPLPALVNIDLSGGDFTPPGSNLQQTVEYYWRSGITWTFSSAVTDLDLYVVYWVFGNTPNSGYDGPSNRQFVFSTAPSQILSGLTGASISGNALVANADGFYNGILRFSGPLTSLSILSATSSSISTQAYTLALPGGSASVSDGASTLALLGAAIGTLGWATRRRRG